MPLRRALAFGRVSGQDAATFCALAEHEIETPRTASEYLTGKAELPVGDAARWFVLNWIRETVNREVGSGSIEEGCDCDECRSVHWLNATRYVSQDSQLRRVSPEQINRFLMGLPQEHGSRFWLTWWSLGCAGRERVAVRVAEGGDRAVSGNPSPPDPLSRTRERGSHSSTGATRSKVMSNE